MLPRNKDKPWWKYSSDLPPTYRNATLCLNPKGQNACTQIVTLPQFMPMVRVFLWKTGLQMGAHSSVELCNSISVYKTETWRRYMQSVDVILDLFQITALIFEISFFLPGSVDGSQEAILKRPLSILSKSLSTHYSLWRSNHKSLLAK
jgi:hypothetical protein